MPSANPVMPESMQSVVTAGITDDPRGGLNLYSLCLGERAWGHVRKIAKVFEGIAPQ